MTGICDIELNDIWFVVAWDTTLEMLSALSYIQDWATAIVGINYWWCF